jgi:hypothetical protein
MYYLLEKSQKTRKSLIRNQSSEKQSIVIIGLCSCLGLWQLAVTFTHAYYPFGALKSKVSG